MDTTTKNKLMFQHTVDKFKKTWTAEYLASMNDGMSRGPTFVLATIANTLPFTAQDVLDVLQVQLRENLKCNGVIEFDIYTEGNHIIVIQGKENVAKYGVRRMFMRAASILGHILLWIVACMSLPYGLMIFHDVFIIPFKAQIGGVSRVTPEYCHRYGYGYCGYIQ